MLPCAEQTEMTLTVNVSAQDVWLLAAILDLILSHDEEGHHQVNCLNFPLALGELLSEASAYFDRQAAEGRDSHDWVAFPSTKDHLCYVVEQAEELMDSVRRFMQVIRGHFGTGRPEWANAETRHESQQAK